MTSVSQVSKLWTNSVRDGTHPKPYACTTFTVLSLVSAMRGTKWPSRGNFIHSTSTRGPPSLVGLKPTLWLKILVFSGSSSSGIKDAQPTSISWAVCSSYEVSQLFGWDVPPRITVPSPPGRGMTYENRPLDLTVFRKGYHFDPTH